MGVFSSILSIFKSDIETSDKNPDAGLRTHYYKSSYDKVYKAILDLYNTSEYNILAESRERGEITVEKNGFPGYFIVVTAINVQAFETAVDFKVSSEKKVPGSYPKMKQEIASYYKVLDSSLIRA
ncbi:cytosolic protein [Bacillus sp. AK031]